MRLRLMLSVPVILAATAIVPAAVGAGDGVSPKVSPKSGGTKQTFTVSFTPRQRTGVKGVVSTYYSVEARTRARSGCVAARVVKVTNTRAGVKRRALLKPGSKWCKGRFTGNVWLVSQPRCGTKPKPGPCPTFPATRRRAGSFSYRVR
jgi:hypothetical protein